MELEKQDETFDEDSVIELGQIAVLSSSRTSLRRSTDGISASRRSLGASKRSLYMNNKQLASKLTLQKSDTSIYKDHVESVNRDQSVKIPLGKLEPVIENEQAMNLKNISGCHDFVCTYKAYFISLISVMFFCLASIMMRYSIWLTGSDHSFIRYICTFIVMFTVLKYKNLSIRGPKNQFKLLLFRGFIGSFALITVYFAILFLKPSDLVAISQTSLVITAILARIFLKERLCLGHFIAITSAVVGVILISKPSVLFSTSNLIKNDHAQLLNCSTSIKFLLNSTNFSTSFSTSTSTSPKVSCNNQSTMLTKEQEKEMSFESLKTGLGIFLTFIGAISTSCVFLVLKKLSNSRVHWASNTIFVCWFGLPFSTIISFTLIRLGYTHVNFQDEKKDLPMDIFYSVVSSIFSLIGQVLLNIALRYEDATKIAITRTTDVLFSCILQYFLLDILIDAISALGALAIMFGSFSILLFKLLETKYDKFCENYYENLVLNNTTEPMLETNINSDKKGENQQIASSNIDSNECKKMDNEYAVKHPHESFKMLILRLIFFQY